MKIFNCLQGVDLPAKSASDFTGLIPASCPPYGMYRNNSDGTPKIDDLLSLAITAQTSREFFILDYENSDAPTVVPDLIRAVKEVCPDLEIGVFGVPSLGPAAVHAIRYPYAIAPFVNLFRSYHETYKLSAYLCPCWYSTGNQSEDYANFALTACLGEIVGQRRMRVFVSNRVAGLSSGTLLLQDYLWSVFEASQSLGIDVVLWSNPSDIFADLADLLAVARRFAAIYPDNPTSNGVKSGDKSVVA